MFKSPIRRLFGLICGLFLIIALSTIPNQQPAKAATGFVYRCGLHFCLNGNYFYYAGANAYEIFTFGGSYGDIETQWMDKASIDNIFAQLQALGATVVRTWLFDHQTWHGFEPSKGVYSNEQFSEFDYEIQSAQAHGIKLIATLENYWPDYGGIDQRLAWEGVSNGDANRWQFFNKSICPGCFTEYKNYVNYVLTRVNHYSGIAYKDDPTIFAWELMNEPRYQNATPNENSTGTTLRAWVDEMGAYIKGIDPNHMLSAGLEGHQAKYGFGGDEGNPFVYIQQSPYIDFATAHPYPTESWANLTIAQTQTLIDAWVSDAKTQIGKPFVMEEFNTNTGDRSQWWTAMMGEIEKDDADGDNFWNYVLTGAGGYNIASGAPELSVFQQHAANMAAKNKPAGPTATPCTCTATFTPTPKPTNTPTVTQTPPPAGAGLTTQIDKGGGTDNSQETTFNFLVKNNGTTAASNVSVRIYYTADGSNSGSGYALEKYYDQSGVATISAPTLDSGSSYYFTISFGTASLAAGAQWEFQTALHLSSWGSTYNGGNDWYHTGYAVGALPASYTNTNYIPAYVSGTLAWGSTPSGGSAATNTPAPATNTPTNTPTFLPPSATPILPTKTNTPVGPTNTPVPPTVTPVPPTKTNTPVGPTNTPVPPTVTPIPPTKTNTPVGPTNTPVPATATKTNTPMPTNTSVAATSTPNASDPCASPTVITGGGSFSVTTATTCFKYVNTSFVNGGMFSVMKDGTSASDTLKWYGGMDQNATSCANQSSTISGNGGQLNNFTIEKDANGQMFLIITGSASNSVTISIQNWQNGAGCSVKPTVHP